jgi:predicted acetyltransferase
MEEEIQYTVDENLDDGLRYTEHTDEKAKRPSRICSLWKDGEKDPVSKLTLLAFESRFGSVTVPADGFAGVQTMPGHRKKGYIAKLITRSLQGIAERADVAFLYGIEGLYWKYGFSSCLPDSEVNLRLSRIPNLGKEDGELEAAGEDDMEGVAELFNAEHAERPWTLVRTAAMWKRLQTENPWQPAPECLVVRERDKILAYALIPGTSYGWNENSFTVMESAAEDYSAATRLLVGLGLKCWQRKTDTLTIKEPADSAVGTVARQWGCEAVTRVTPDGGGMACILNRPQLIETVGPEFDRREAGLWNSGETASVRNRLASGDIIPDSGNLVKLLMGYWSVRDAVAAGVGIPEGDRRILELWFPGGGTPGLLQPHAHQFDRY